MPQPTAITIHDALAHLAWAFTRVADNASRSAEHADMRTIADALAYTFDRFAAAHLTPGEPMSDDQAIHLAAVATLSVRNAIARRPC